MRCVLCGVEVTLLDLDGEGVGGWPAHEHCANAYRAELAAVLAAAEAMVLAEPDPRRHRHHLRPAA